jgi:hypothetical protein|tara:strand:+ start:675 stop:851 length:177 start_codon:yes stop_codon:yes gene_type:complete
MNNPDKKCSCCGSSIKENAKEEFWTLGQEGWPLFKGHICDVCHEEWEPQIRSARMVQA